MTLAVLRAGAAVAVLTVFAAAPAHAMISYAACLQQADPSVCIVGKAIDGSGTRAWTDRIDDLVRSGDVDRTAAFAAQVRPLSGLLANLHARPSDGDIAAVDLVDPQAAKILREAAATDLGWTREAASHGAELTTRTLPPETVAGFTLAAAAYRSADPFADPTVQARIALMPKDAAGSEQAFLLRAMRSMRPEGPSEAYAVAPLGAPAVLARAGAVAQPSAEFLATLATFAWWAGDDGAAAKALDALKGQPPGAAAAYWLVEARLWAALGKPALAQAVLDAQGEGHDKLMADIEVADAWLKVGDKAHAAAIADSILANASDDPAVWTAVPQLLARAGLADEALAAARVFTTRAEAADRPSRSAALAAASEALTGIGRDAEGCALARRSLALVNDSAGAQVALWKSQYGTEVPINIWLGVDHSQDPAPIEDVRAAYRERAAAALSDCGAAAEAAKARGGKGGAWQDIVAVHDASLSPAERLKTAAAYAASQPEVAARLADAAGHEPEPEDSVARLMWRDGQAYAAAAAGRPDQARVALASAVRGLDELGNPDDRQATALILARDHRAIEALVTDHAPFGRRLPQ
jgi:hypothetical protein